MAYDQTFWKPMLPTEAARVFEELAAPWWVSGGWAIDLFLGRQTRDHHDLDAGIFRGDQLALQSHLESWELAAADPLGTLRPWIIGEVLPAPVHDIWCRRDGAGPWELQLMLNEGDSETWISRRDPKVRMSTAEAMRRSADGIPFLAPEIQFYFKAKNLNDRDEADFDSCLASLSAEQRAWLASAIASEIERHPWLTRM
jgi:hypothetical protein